MSGMDFVSVPLTIRTETRRNSGTTHALDVDGMVRALRDTNGRSYSACPTWQTGGFGICGDVIAFTITSGLSGVAESLPAKMRPQTSWKCSISFCLSNGLHRASCWTGMTGLTSRA